MNTPDEWDDPDFIGACGSCNRTAPVNMLSDPYIEALFPEDNPEPEPFCYGCFCNRSDEI